MSRCYPTEFLFSIEQKGFVQRRFERIPFHIEPKADGNLGSAEKLAGEGEDKLRRMKCEFRSGRRAGRSIVFNSQGLVAAGAGQMRFIQMRKRPPGS
jgi:hypothetical protein